MLGRSARFRSLFGGSALVLLAAAAVIVLGRGHVRSPGDANPAAAFPVLVDANAAGDRTAVWLAVAGEATAGNSRPVRIRVFRHGRSGSWRAFAAPPALESPESALSIAVVEGEPCLSYARPPGLTPYVACLGDTGWRQLAGGALRTGLIPNQLEALGGRLYELVRDPAGARHIVLTRMHGTWTPVGGPIPSGQAIGALGVRADHGLLAPAVATEVVSGRAARQVWVLDRGGWRVLGPALAGVGQGPQVAGPVVAGGRAFIAATDANGKPWWPFSVYTSTGAGWRRDRGASLNRGPGNAQGEIDRVNGDVWAMWEQDALRPGARFSSVIRLARIDPHTGRVVENRQLAAGTGTGILGHLTVLATLGHAYAVYLAPSTRRNKPPRVVLARVG